MTNEDWQSALTNDSSPLKVVQPMTLQVQFHKCLITDDVVLPKIRLLGKLPSVAINITGIIFYKFILIVY
jgi:vacuolar protein sorting-associated protein 13A/C